MKLNTLRKQEQQRIEQRTWEALRKAQTTRPAKFKPTTTQTDYWAEPGIAG